MYNPIKFWSTLWPRWRGWCFKLIGSNYRTVKYGSVHFADLFSMDYPNGPVPWTTWMDYPWTTLKFVTNITILMIPTKRCDGSDQLQYSKRPHLTIHSSVHCLSTGRLREVKSKGKYQTLAIKVVTVAYKRWTLTAGSIYSDLTCKLLVFLKTGHWGEMFAYERWSQPEARLHFNPQTFTTWASGPLPQNIGLEQVFLLFPTWQGTAPSCISTANQNSVANRHRTPPRVNDNYFFNASN